ncbi:MAG: DUF6614 family protein [Aliishimia sp.]
MIDLKQEAKSLAFAKALDTWMEHLRNAGTIQSWRLTRRFKLSALQVHKTIPSPNYTALYMI